jgi:hypothetical protein
VGSNVDEIFMDRLSNALELLYLRWTPLRYELCSTLFQYHEVVVLLCFYESLLSADRLLNTFKNRGGLHPIQEACHRPHVRV